MMKVCFALLSAFPAAAARPEITDKKNRGTSRQAEPNCVLSALPF